LFYGRIDTVERGGTKQTSLEPVMSQVCDICGKGPQFGNNISHAHNITRRKWSVNLQAVKALVNGVSKRIRVCTSCIKSGKVAKGTGTKAVKA
jgi:large subunit ribosomal protein L28